MSPLDHDHPVNPAALAEARAGVLTRDEAERLANLLSVLSDQVRSRLLFALVSVHELCVGDLAIALGDASEDQTSYALKTLRNAGLVQTRRDGRIINYRLADGFPHRLLEHCLRQLLTITEPRDRP
jgi:DNA-binding transcriptional ArsR family regulator